jgi:uncharacterized protein with HEPN domain
LAHLLRERGRAALNSDPLLHLSAESRVMRTGDLVKKLMASDGELAELSILQKAARARDIVAHHYHRIDSDQLWRTISESFIELERWLEDSAP